MRPLRPLSLAAGYLVAALWCSPTSTRASVHENPAFGCRLTAPDSWHVRRSIDGALMLLTSDGDEEVTVGLKFKYVAEPLDGQKLARLYKAHRERLVGLSRELQVTTKPSRSRVGMLPAYAFAFRYRTIIDEEEVEHRYYLTTSAPHGDRLLMVAAAVKGLRQAVSERRWAVDAILTSFVVDGLPEGKDSKPAAPLPSGFGPHDDVVCLGKKTLEAAVAGGPSLTSTSVLEQRTAVTARRPVEASGAGSGTDGTATSQFDLFSRAKRVTDPSVVAAVRGNLMERNHQRTVEEKKRSLQYFGGFRDAEVDATN